MSEQQGTESSCTCDHCIAACEHYPGWMTPDEASAAIKAGYARQLMKDWFHIGARRIFVLCPASEGYGGELAPETSLMGMFFGGGIGPCVMLKDRRCTIHDSGFKPIHCREALCCQRYVSGEEAKRRVMEMWRNRRVMEMWRNRRGKEVMREWRNALKNSDKSAPRADVEHVGA